MTRLPTPGSDDGSWGDILNTYLGISHANDGTLNTNVVGTSQLQNTAVTSAKLDSPTQTSLTKANSAVQSVNGKSGNSVTLAAADVSAVPTSQLGTASGVATLNSSSQLTGSQLPGSVVAASQQPFATPTNRFPFNIAATLNGPTAAASGTSNVVGLNESVTITGDFTGITGSDPGFVWGREVFVVTGASANDAAGITNLIGLNFEVAIQSPSPAHMTVARGGSSGINFWGASAAALVDVMESFRVQAPGRINGATSAAVASTVYGLFVEDVEAAAVGATGAFSLYVAGGIARFNTSRLDVNGTIAGITGAALNVEAGTNATDSKLTLWTGSAANGSIQAKIPKSAATFAVNDGTNDVFTIGRTAIVSSNQTAGVTFQPTATGRNALSVKNFAGQTADPLQLLESDGTTVRFGQDPLGRMFLSKQVAPAARSGYGGIYVATDGTLHYLNDGSVDTIIGSSGASGERQLEISGFATPKAVTGTGTWAPSVSNNAYFCGYVTNSGGTPAVNDTIAFYDVWLDAGTWEADILGLQATDGGQLSVALVGPATVSITGTVELYAGSNTATRQTLTGAVISTPGLYSLRLTITGHNGSSSGFRVRFSGAILTRTA